MFAILWLLFAYNNERPMTNKYAIKIAPLTADDYKAWLVLWQNYLSFYQASLPLKVINATWQNIVDSNAAIYGFGAWNYSELVGFTHVVLHPNTWNTTQCCYLEDLYVSDSVRGQGIGRKLIEHVYTFADEQNCNRVYWHTQEDNTQARILYDKVATKTDMLQYRKNL